MLIINQGWAFASVAVVEHQYYKATNKIVSLSEEQAVDCYYLRRDGCTGGNAGGALEYFQKGIELTNDYPYTNVGTVITLKLFH